MSKISTLQEAIQEVGDRFYNQQKNYKPKRIKKSEYIEDLETLLGEPIVSIDRMTIPGIQKLIELIERKLQS